MEKTLSIDGVIRVFVTIAAILLSSTGCKAPGTTVIDQKKPWIADGRTSVTAKILTYNVAGLPDLFSSSRPSVNHLVISPKLNNFDIVLVQEDFRYHKSLSSQVTLPYSSGLTRKGLFGLGDGLNRFSVYGFENYNRITWTKSHGIFSHSNDSLAPKGFTAAAHHLSRYIEVDIYNLHMDAGKNHKDYLAREVQISQLSEVLDEKSRGKAVIVAGDWNLKENRPNDRALLERFKETHSLLDAREVLSAGQDRIDRILYRNGEGVEIVPLSYTVESNMFRDGAGSALSDHEAVSVQFLFRTRP